MAKRISETFNLEGINFPVSLKDIIKFEKFNNIKINILCCEKK